MFLFHYITRTPFLLKLLLADTDAVFCIVEGRPYILNSQLYSQGQRVCRSKFVNKLQLTLKLHHFLKHIVGDTPIMVQQSKDGSLGKEAALSMIDRFIYFFRAGGMMPALTAL